MMAPMRTSRQLFRSSRRALVFTASMGLVLGTFAPAQAKTDPIVDAFVKAFVTSFESSTGTKIPTSEATCIGTKFLAKIDVNELSKSAASNDLTKPQKAALAGAFGACLSGNTYKAVLKHNLAKQFTQKQITCIGDKAVTKLGVPALIALDFKDYVGVTAATTAANAKTTAELTKIIKACP